MRPTLKHVPDHPARVYTIADLNAWEANNLNPEGRYIGEPLQDYGFPFRNFEHIPADKRFHAMAYQRMARERVISAVKEAR
jgi:hypothetical protein